MKQPLKRKRNDALSEDRIITILLVLIGMGLLALIVLGALLLRQSMQGGSLGLIPNVPPTEMVLPASTIEPTAMIQQTAALPPTSIVSTAVVPTVDCSSSTLVIGSATLQIQTITPAADGSLNVPADASGIAYWVEGTEGNYLFLLSSTPDNISLMSTITVGSVAKTTWSDCSSLTYDLATPEPNPANSSTLLDQLTSGITIFFESDMSGNGFIVRGELTELIFP